MSSATPTRAQFASGAAVSELEPTMMQLADRSDAPPRLRQVLQGLLALCAGEMRQHLEQTLIEFERQLVRLADKATVNEQNRCFDSIHEMKRKRADVAPRFVRSLEDALARGEHRNSRFAAGRDGPPPKLHLALSDGTQMDESLVLSDIAVRVESRVREPLYTLGHRFGALAGTPRVAVEVMPLAPRSIVESLRHATCRLDLPLEHRLMMYRCFERVAMNHIGPLYAAFNQFLVDQDVLPQLHTLSTTLQNAELSGSTDRLARDAHSPNPAAEAAGVRGANLIRPVAGSSRIREPTRPGDLFATLRQLLGECRRAEAYMAAGDELQAVLAALQSRRAAARSAQDGLSVSSGEQLKHEIVALLRERCTDGRAAQIGEEDSDTVELTAMLFEFLSHGVRADGVANWILAKLQIPVLRVALGDKRFFADRSHPARRLLNDLVEIGRFWVDEIDVEKDPALIDKLQRVTDQVAFEYQGDALVFAAALQELSLHMEALGSNAVAEERHHVDAAIGRENLERYRALAAAAIGERIARREPAEFLRMLLERAWTDVLIVTQVREGGESALYARRVAVIDQLLAACGDGAPQDLRTSELSAELEAGLAQIAMRAEDIHAVSRRLFAPADMDEANPMSQTELAIKLKLKPRVQGLEGAFAASSPETAESLTQLTDVEQASFDRLHALPHGTWFEFAVNDHGDTVRRKLLWFSVRTGRCLFVNQCGAPCEEQTLREVARDMAVGRARVVGEEQDAVVDHAWTAICAALKNFSSGKRRGRVVEQQPATEPQSAITHHEQTTRTLLLVDDEANIQRALMRTLRNEGYRILNAANASEATTLLDRHEVDVIISDQRMPGLMGTEFLSNVKATYPNTVRILLSGFSDAATVTDAINRGAIYKFLTKPWDDEDIRAQVREAFDACEAC